MKSIYTYGGQFAQRHLTVGCLIKNAAERSRALAGYRAAVMDGSFPDAATSVSMHGDELDKLKEGLDKLRPVHL